MSRILRKRTRVSYCEYEEPDLDEYIFCSSCEDYVYEYCSIHGPLLIVPDTRIPVDAKLPPQLTRAMLTLPHVFLHIAPSSIPGAGLGVFCSRAMPADVRFGPYAGRNTKEAASDYCWQIYNNDRTPRHLVDGGDPNAANWLRYVNCCRNWREQNLVAYQYRGQIYYRTLRVVPKGVELLVYYGSEFARRLGLLPSPPYATSLPTPTPIPDTKLDPDTTKTLKLPSPSITANSSPTKHENKLSSTVIAKTKVVKQKGTEAAPSNNKYQEAPASIAGTAIFYYNCSHCKYSCVSADILEKHTNLHDITRKYECDVCSMRFATNGELKNHFKTHSGEKPFKCDQCEYRCTQNGNLKRHIQTHSGEKTFKCNQCEYRCTQNGHLKSHNKTHSGEKPFKCDQCEYRCTQNSNLKRHIKTHSGEKPFKCDQCEYRCTTSGDLKRHIRTHNGEKPFKCDQCEYRCTRSSHLKTHLRTHSGEKPFKCDQCEYRCATSGDLKRHIRTHNGEKPFKCDQCEYRCTRSSHLKTHIKTHSKK